MEKLKLLTKFDVEIRQICEPLFNYFGLNFFCYVKRFPNKKHFSLCSNALWQQHFYENKFHLSGHAYEYCNEYSNYQCGNTLWVTMSYHNPIRQSIESFNIGNGLTLTQLNSDSIEFFHFGAELENVEVVNSYLNQMEDYQRFTYYFRDKAESIITQAETEAIIPLGREVSVVQRGRLDLHNEQALSDLLDIDKVYINENCSLTKRELECLDLFVKGLSAREIATVLHKSVRTVESQISQLKCKLDCQKNTQLIVKAIKLGIV